MYADAGVSGATRDRPALKRLLADAKAGMINRLVVTKLDRIGHRAADILAVGRLSDCWDRGWERGRGRR